MGAGPLTLLAATVLLSAFVQGLSGLGFSLLAAPVIAQTVPGPSSIGLLNALALSQNAFMVWREKGAINRPVVRLLVPGLLAGMVCGYALVRWLPADWRPLVVAASSLASLAALICWRPKPGAAGASTASFWSGTVNTYAGVGGPPLAAYLLRQGMGHGDYIRTQQLVFAGLNAVSLPLLGLPPVDLSWTLVALALVAAGSTLGTFARRFVSPSTARRATEMTVAAVALTALVRALLVAFQ